MFWEHSPYWTNTTSGWLRADSPVDEEEIKIKMDDGVAGYIFDHAVRKFGPKLASHYKPVENEVKFVELSELC